MADDPLMEGEEVVYATEKHWMAPLADSWTAILMILAAAVVAWLEPEQTTGVMGFVGRLLELVKLVLVFGGVILIVYNVLNWRVAWVKVTNFRILGHEGLLRSRETDTLLQSVSDVRTKSSFVGRQLKYGDITILTASGEAGADGFTSLKDIETLKKRILEQKTKQTGAFAATIGAAAQPQAAAAPASAQAGQADTMATLSSLGQLRDSGVISAEEFEAKKQELLARI